MINPNTVFLFMLVVFLIDSGVNFFIRAPIFVPVAIVALPILWIILWKSGRKNTFLLVFISVFLLATMINNFIYQFDKKNISDLMFILLFPTIYYFYKLKPEKILPRSIHIFFIVSLIMLSFTFVGYNSGSWLPNDQVIKKRSEIMEVAKADKESALETDHIPFIILELFRTYNNGLFRVPHLANYFFGFLFLFYGFAFQKKRKWYFFIAMLVSIILMLYSGSRTFVVVALLALILFLFNRKTLGFLLALSVIMVLMIVYRFELYMNLEGTYLEHYASLIVTTIDNYTNLSRIKIWNSWWDEIQQFTWYDYLIGKTFIASKSANFENIKFREWFHNDFLSIVYAYGILPLILYSAFFYKVYKENSKFIRKNTFLFVYFFAMVFSAFFNGFYYYFPVFLIFIFVYMVRVEKKKKITL